MSNGRARSIAPAAPPEAATTVYGNKPATLPTKQFSDSVPVGTLRLSGLVKTTNGYAVAMLELTPEDWASLSRKQLGRSQKFKEHVAAEHKVLVMKLGQTA